MEIEKITDSEGNKIQFLNYDGHVFHPNFNPDIAGTLQELRSFESRPDDVVICSFPKSGLHWVFNIVGHLTQGNISYKGTPMYLEYHSLDEFKKLPEPRVYAFHLLFSLLPKQIQEDKCRIIHIVRNPKDTVVSYYKFIEKLTVTDYHGSFSGFLKFFLGDKFFYDSWFTYVKEWNDAISQHPTHNILQLTYEEIKTNPYDVIVKISKFLNLEKDEASLREVEEAVRFDKMKTDHDVSAAGSDMTEFCDRVLPIYRKGEIGDWKNTLTVAQSEQFDEVYKQKMTGYEHIKFQYE